MNKTTIAHKTERGQAIILIILAVVGMFGFGALAIDVGQVYFARRSSQAAADNAALAAAYEAAGGSKDSTKAIAKAYQIASDNGYNNDGVNNWVTVRNPPEGNEYCPQCGVLEAQEYYEVRITQRTSPIFAHFVFAGVEQTTVRAIAHAKTASSPTGADALLSTSNISTSMEFDGNIATKVEGGNIRSMGGIIKNGNGAGSVTVINGNIYYATVNGNPGFFPGAQQKPAGGIPMIPEPWCPTSAEAASWTKGDGYSTQTINGTKYFYYPSGLDGSKKDVTILEPGIHCVDGGIGKGKIQGDGVLIVLLSGGIKQTGQDYTDIRAANKIVDKNGNSYGGLVFYAPMSNTNAFKFAGNSGAYFEGTFYAPGAECTIGGTEDGRAIHSAFVCNTFKFHGNPNFNIVYRQEENYRMPPTVQLIE